MTGQYRTFLLHALTVCVTAAVVLGITVATPLGNRLGGCLRRRLSSQNRVRWQPDDPIDQRQLAIRYAFDEEYEKAMATARKAVSLAPEDPAGWKTVGVVASNWRAATFSASKNGTTAREKRAELEDVLKEQGLKLLKWCERQAEKDHYCDRLFLEYAEFAAMFLTRGGEPARAEAALELGEKVARKWKAGGIATKKQAADRFLKRAKKLKPRTSSED